MCRVPQNIKELARKQAQKSNMKHRIGAVIFDNKGNVIATGFNRWIRQTNREKNRENFPPYHFSIHAEADAITDCSWEELYGASIYVYRLGGRLAKPCRHCMALITKVGIEKVYWSG